MKKTFLLWIVVLAILFFSSCGRTDTAETTAQTPKQKLQITVVSFNVRREYSTDLGVRSWAQRKEPFIKYLNDLSADIFCMQEISKNILHDITQGLAHSYDYQYFESNLVLYRRDALQLVQKGAFYLNSEPTVKEVGWDGKNVRNCQFLQFSHGESGVIFDVFNTHFDAFGEKAQPESAALLNKLLANCEYPFLLCGDLNFRETHEAYQTITQNMIDCRKVAPQTDDGATYQGWGAVADGTGTPIDYCLASPSGVEPLRFQILRDRWDEENFYSDHYAIMCSVNILY